tara:strand:- start:1180 stop:1416 length:237 start_codon:yes stop_codon:yes gene_type:complete
MIESIKEIRPDWYLIHLEGTRYYQIWNKWDLFDLLLKSTNIDLKTPKPQLTLWDEDFPMPYEKLESIVDDLINIKNKK